MYFQGPTSLLNNYNLTNYNCGKYTHEHEIFEKSRENIPFVIDFSCCYHVEDLEENKEIENNCEVSGRSFCFKMSVDVFTIEAFYHAT